MKEPPFNLVNADLSELNTSSKRNYRLILKIVLPFLAIVLLVAFSRAIYHFFYTHNDYFLLQEVTIDTKENGLLKTMAEAQLAFNGITPQEIHLPEIDLRSLRNALLENPRIQEVAIRRRFPDKLLLQITPRVPVAIVRHPVGRNKFAEVRIDREGIIVPNDLQGATKTLPILMSRRASSFFVMGQATTDVGLRAFLDYNKVVTSRLDGDCYNTKMCTFNDNSEQMTIHLLPIPPFREGATMILPYSNISATLDRVGIVVKMRREQLQTILRIDGTYDNIPVVP